MHAIRLNEIRETARASNACNGCDFLVVQASLLYEAEIESEDREITTTGTPGRVIR